MPRIELTNLKQLKETHLNQPNLTKEDKKELFKIWVAAREENRAKIIAPIEYWYGKSEERIVTLKGKDDLNCPCPASIHINGSEFFLYEDFELKIGGSLLTISFKGRELFRIRIEDITSYECYI